MKIKYTAISLMLAACLSGCGNGTEHKAAPEDKNTAREETAEPAEEILSGMTVDEKINQLFFITPEALTGTSTAVKADETTKAALENHPVGGLIYFSSNIESETQLKEMLKNTEEYGRELCKAPLFLGVDEEGGSVARLGNSGIEGTVHTEDMRLIGETKDKSRAFDVGASIGGYLAEYGFNIDFAPVADVLTNPENTVVKDRSFGSDPTLVTEMAESFSDGLNSKGIISCYKHFPGHGATKDDTHEGFAYTYKTLEELETAELIPFADAAAKRADVIMVGHISLPNVVGDNKPASVSPEIINGMLRDKLNFEGVVITDSLSMKALTELYTPDEAAVKALEAGADMILMPENFGVAFEGVSKAVESGRITEERLNLSVKRILRLKTEKLLNKAENLS